MFIFCWLYFRWSVGISLVSSSGLVGLGTRFVSPLLFPPPPVVLKTSFLSFERRPLKNA